MEPRDVIADALFAAVGFDERDETDHRDAMEVVDAVLVALAEAGYVLCREEPGAAFGSVFVPVEREP